MKPKTLTPEELPDHPFEIGAKVVAVETCPPWLTKGREYVATDRFISGWGEFAKPHIYVTSDDGERRPFFASRFRSPEGEG
jgi:hypothetical protein